MRMTTKEEVITISTQDNITDDELLQYMGAVAVMYQAMHASPFPFLICKNENDDFYGKSLSCVFKRYEEKT